MSTTPATNRDRTAPATRANPAPGTGGDPLDQPRRTSRPLLLGIGALSLAAALVGLLAPSAVVAPAMAGMSMTHYMELLSVRQPWNLLLFMALPVVLAETLAITELAILLGRAPRWVHQLSRAAGLLAGPVMLGILLHLLRNAVIPLTVHGGWRGWADLVAVLAYLAGAFPLMLITLVELGVLGRTGREARRLHVVGVAAFLVVAHVAMILGMLDPAVTGWSQGGGHHHDMPGMGASAMPSMPGMGASPMPSMAGMTASSMPSMAGMDHSMPVVMPSHS